MFFSQGDKNNMILRLFSVNSNIDNYVLHVDRDSEELLRKNNQVDMILTIVYYKTMSVFLQVRKNVSCYCSF